MRVAFRTDASTQIGTGHFMRCLTLAEELKKQDAHICFISRNLPLHLIEMLNKKGIELIALRAHDNSGSVDELAHSSWLCVSQAQDAKATVKGLSGQVYDWMIVDHYALDVRWESIVRPNVKKIMVIDDLADRRHDCDILLDQNYYADMQTRYNGKVSSHCQLLLGPNYALLREEFRALRQQVKVRNGKIKKVLVFFGGVDADNYTFQAIEALAELNAGLQVDVVIGAQHPFKEMIENACVKHGYVCHVQTPYMAKLMADADLAIGAGGTATWERCCLGLPTLTLCLAENQRKQIADAAETGVLYAPKVDSDLTDTLQLHIKTLLANPALIKLISNSAMKLVDGKGTFRVANSMAHGFIKIRHATQDDSISIFEWRNHPKIRNISRKSGSISWDEHQKWLDAVLADTSRHLLIGSINNLKVGVVRFDVVGVIAEVSIYLVPDASVIGQGKNLLLASETWLKVNHPEILKINANVLGGNEASNKLFFSTSYNIEMTSFKKDLRGVK
jgi:UDP-2,4-diacetamido-2,4,6-trideoxy-beta-L-altropyranose hydrolase